MSPSISPSGDRNDQLVNDPTSELFASLADFYRENGLLPEAIEICRSGLENSPDNIEGRLVLAKCFLAARDFGNAREQVTRVLTLQPENTSAKKLLVDIDREDKPAPTPRPIAAEVQAKRPEEAHQLNEPRPVLEYTEPESPPLAPDRKTAPPSKPHPETRDVQPAAPAQAQTERGPQTNYHRVLQDLVQTPQIMAGLLVDESGFVVASAYDPKSQAAADEEAAGALAVSIFKTGRESMQKIRMGELERIVIDTAGEKIFLNRAGPMLLLVSAETSAKVGLVAVNTRQAVDRVRGQGGR